MLTTVYINEKRVDLPLGVVIVVNRQIGKLGDLRSRQVSYTNRFKLPLTSTNKDALDLPDQVGPDSDGSYQNHEGRIFSEGYPLLPSGRTRVIEVNDQIEVQIVDAAKNLYSTLESLDLHSIDWTDLDHEFNSTNAGASVANTSGYIYGIGDFGTLENVSSSIVQVETNPPSYFVHDIMARIFSAQGYTLEGDLLTNARYLSMVIPLSRKFEHSDRYKAERSFRKSTDQSYLFADVATNTQNQKFNASIPDLEFSPGADGTYDATVSFEIDNYQENFVSGDSVVPQIAIYLNNTFVKSFTLNGNGAFTFSETGISMVVGDVLSVRVIADFVVNGFNPATYQFDFVTGSFFSPEVDPSVNIGEIITAESIIPKMKQLEFAKGIFQMFNIWPEVNTLKNTVILHPFEDVKDKSNARNWSNRLRKLPGQKNWYTSKQTRFNEYGQKTYLRFKEDDSLLDPTFADGVISVEDLTLDEEKTMITLPFAATEHVERLAGGYEMAFLPVFVIDDTDTQSIVKNRQSNLKQRICYVHYPNSAGIRLTDGVNADVDIIAPNIPFLSFVRKDRADNIGFAANLLALHYTQLSRAMRKPLRLSVLADLNIVDVIDFDFLAPVYFSQFGAYFYVETIKYEAGELAELDIIRLD